MKPLIRLSLEFVESVPEKLAERRLYVSIRYGTVMHLCCCGCGTEVVTPLSPTDWSMRYDGKTLSLDPSIGNWGFPCRSHYWIKNNCVHWAESWSEELIERTRRHDAMLKDEYYEKQESKPKESTANDSVDTPPPPPKRRSLWNRIRSLLRRRK